MPSLSRRAAFLNGGRKSWLNVEGSVHFHHIAPLRTPEVGFNRKLIAFDLISTLINLYYVCNFLYQLFQLIANVDLVTSQSCISSLKRMNFTGRNKWHVILFYAYFPLDPEQIPNK